MELYSEERTTGIEEGLGDLEPLGPVLVVVAVGELVGHVGNGADSLLRVLSVMHLQ